MYTRWPKAGGYYNVAVDSAMPEEESDVVTKTAPQGPNLGCVVTPVLRALYKCILSVTDTRRSQSKQTR